MTTRMAERPKAHHRTIYRGGWWIRACEWKGTPTKPGGCHGSPFPGVLGHIEPDDRSGYSDDRARVRVGRPHRVSTHGGQADPKVSVNLSNPEVDVDVDRQRAADLGVRMSTIGTTLRLMMSGDDIVTHYREGTEEHPVKIRVLEEQRRDVASIGAAHGPGGGRSGPHRQHRADRTGVRSEHAAAFQPPVLDRVDLGRYAGSRAG
jgi:hypothetical protein